MMVLIVMEMISTICRDTGRPQARLVPPWIQRTADRISNRNLLKGRRWQKWMSVRRLVGIIGWFLAWQLSERLKMMIGLTWFSRGLNCYWCLVVGSWSSAGTIWWRKGWISLQIEHTSFVNRRLITSPFNCSHWLFWHLTQSVCCFLEFSDSGLPRNSAVGLIFANTYIAVAGLLEDDVVRIEQMASKKQKNEWYIPGWNDSCCGPNKAVIVLFLPWEAPWL